MTEFRGVVHNGLIVVEPGHALPEGTLVVVRPVSNVSPMPTPAPQPLSPEIAAKMPPVIAPGWPPGYFETLLSGAVDESWERPPQPPADRRDPLE